MKHINSYRKKKLAVTIFLTERTLWYWYGDFYLNSPFLICLGFYSFTLMPFAIVRIFCVSIYLICLGVLFIHLLLMPFAIVRIFCVSIFDMSRVLFIHLFAPFFCYCIRAFYFFTLTLGYCWRFYFFSFIVLGLSILTPLL